MSNHAGLGLNLRQFLLGAALSCSVVAAEGVGTAAAAPKTLAPLETEFLATLYAPLHAPMTASPNLLIFHPRAGGSLHGRINAEVIDPTGDWVRVMPNGSMRIDVRLTARLDDGELMHVTYGGVLKKPSDSSWSRFLAGEKIESPEWYYVVAPLFETSSKKYGWLNDVQAIGRFTSMQAGPNAHVAFEILEIR